MTTWNANVHQFTDGVDTLSAADVNPVIASLATRDQYLFERIDSYSDKTVLLSYNQPVAVNLPSGTPVFFDTTSGQPILKSAKGGFASTSAPTHLEPAQSAYIFGLIKNNYSGPSGDPTVYGDVYVKGLLDGNNTEFPITFLDLLDTVSANEVAGTLPPGPLYLSSEEAGKFTIFPGGAAIFVGYYLGNNQFVLAPNIDSLNQLYFNYHLFLNPEAAGIPNEYSAGLWTIHHSVSAANDAENKVGWITADDAEVALGLTIPTGAKFYYNLPTNQTIKDTTEDTGQPYYLTSEQKNDAILLKKALPAYPGAYTMVFANGVLQTQYDTDHTDGAYIINENGIWWCLESTQYIPWATNSGPLTLQVFITKLNPNLADSIVTSLTSGNQAIEISGPNGENASTGDLTVKLLLPISNVSTSGGNGKAVQSISFDSDGGTVTTLQSDVVNSIVVGPGINMSQRIPGQVVLSLANFSLTGEVEDIEPEESDFVYKGLHSYLRLKSPAINQRVGFVGKIKLPDSLPSNTNLSIKLIGFADSPQASTNTDVNFVFEYATSTTSSSISSAVNSSAVVVPGSKFPALNQATIYKNDSDPATPYFSIPSNKFTAGSYVNFRIARTNGSYPNMIGILGVLWTIE